MFLNNHPAIAKGIGEGIFGAFALGIAGIGATSVAAARSIFRLNQQLTLLSLQGGSGAGFRDAAEGGMIARGGLIGRAGAAIAAFFSGGWLRSVALAGILRGGIIGRVLTGFAEVGARGIPIVGWILVRLRRLRHLQQSSRNCRIS